MQIVIPMGGAGARFLEKGYREPKPLIRVGGRPMIEYVIRLFPGEEDFLFVARQEHLDSTPLEKVIHEILPSSTIVGIESHAQGPIFSLLRTQDHIKDVSPVIVNYCDFYMLWNYENFKAKMAAQNPASASVCYRGFHPHLLGPNLYAGVRTDERGNALEVREKYSFTADKMDTWQQAGTFYFQSGALLKKYAKALVASGTSLDGEYYASQLFNPIIQDGFSSVIYPADYFCQWGTPEDLAEYVKWIDLVRASKDGALPEGLSGADRRIFLYWQSFLAKNPFPWLPAFTS